MAANPHHAKPARRHRVTATSSRRTPATPPPAVPIPTPAPPAAILNGDLSTGDLSQWSVLTPNGNGDVSAVPNPHPDPNFSGAYAADFSIGSANANPQGNPSAELIGMAHKLYPGDDFYLGFSVYLPSSFPQHICYAADGTWIYSCWMQLMEIYGAPYAGPSPISLDVLGGNGPGHANQFIFQAPAQSITSSFPGGAVWRSTPFATSPTGWQAFVWHVHLSACGGTVSCSGGQLPGFVELWFNGVQQRFYDGSTRISYATLNASNWCSPGMGPNCGFDALFLQHYRGPSPDYATGAAGSSSTYAPTYPNGVITTYLGDTKIGTSYSAVAPH